MALLTRWTLALMTLAALAASLPAQPRGTLVALHISDGPNPLYTLCSFELNEANRLNALGEVQVRMPPNAFRTLHRLGAESILVLQREPWGLLNVPWSLSAEGMPVLSEPVSVASAGLVAQWSSVPIGWPNLRNLYVIARNIDPTHQRIVLEPTIELGDACPDPPGMGSMVYPEEVRGYSVVDISTGEETLILDPREECRGHGWTNAAWSPDGRWLAFHTYPAIGSMTIGVGSYPLEEHPRTHDLRIWDSETGQIWRVVPPGFSGHPRGCPTKPFTPVWSPDSERVLFAHLSEPPLEESQWYSEELWWADVTTREVQRAPTRVFWDSVQATWLNGGNRVVVSSVAGETKGYYLVDLDTRARRLLWVTEDEHPDRIRHPHFPDDLFVTPDDSMLILTNHARLYGADLREGADSRPVSLIQFPRGGEAQALWVAD